MVVLVFEAYQRYCRPLPPPLAVSVKVPAPQRDWLLAEGVPGTLFTVATTRLRLLWQPVLVLRSST